MVRPLKVGRNRRRLTLYDVPESSGDTWAQPSQTPVQIGQFWAFVRPLQGQEQLNARQIWPTATHMILMRWLGSSIPTSSDNPNGYMMPQMKLIDVADGEVFNVLFAENVEKRNRQWLLTCEQKIGATS